jgi:porphyrinogen peroxidase
VLFASGSPHWFHSALTQFAITNHVSTHRPRRIGLTRMSEPQPILTPLTESAIFLVLTVHAGSETDVADFLSDVPGLKRSVGFRVPEAELTCVAGIGSSLWDRLTSGPRPADLHPFRALVGPRHIAPATPGDLLFHIRAHRFDLCFELAQRLAERLRGLAEVVDEVHGFRSFDERDVLGFVDGTENPEGDAAADAVLIGDEDPQFAGGSYVIVQKYVHDLTAWDALSTEDQELAIGRSKLSDIEMPDEDKPANSHLALNVITGPDGEERQIMRFNMPFGRVGRAEFGTYYIAYARTAELIELMLSHMFLGDPPGTTDRILDFSTALTGCLFFVPPLEMLDDITAAGAEAAVAPAPAAATDPGHGSLSIGSLRGQPTDADL